MKAAPKKKTFASQRKLVLADGIPVHCAYDRLVPVVELVPNPRNPNAHPERQLEVFAKLIRHHGWRSAIVVSNQSGFIVQGAGRYQVARLLGVSEVPVNFQDFATPADEEAQLLADNLIAEMSETDEPALRAMVLDLRAAKFDMDLTGLSETDLQELEASGSPTAPAAFPEPDETIEVNTTCPKCAYQWSITPSAKKKGRK